MSDESRLNSVLNLAFHPETGEGEAIAAFLRARVMKARGVKETINIKPQPTNRSSHHTLKMVPARYYFSIIKELTKKAFDQNVLLKIDMNLHSELKLS
jgi:hypothetical protein